MIDNEVLKTAEEFKKQWSLGGETQPILNLDGSWPSVGVLDQITFPLRFRDDLLPVEKQIISGAAAYLAVLGHECWESFGAEVHVGKAQNGIFIKATKADSLPAGTEFVVEIEKHLSGFLQNIPLPFPVLASFERELYPDHNFLSLFGIGIMLGLSPFGDGHWVNEDLDTFSSQIGQAAKVLAKQSAAWYERVFPDEPLGQVAELYLDNLIYPPTMMAEELPALKALEGVFRFIEEYQLSPANVLKLAHNLALSPDELLSQVGLAVYAGLINEEPSPQVSAAAQGKGLYMGLLRGAMLITRDRFALRSDWLEQKEFTHEDKKRIELEQQLGFLPWINLPTKRIMDSELREIVFSLIIFDVEAATRQLDAFIEETPADVDVRLQRIYIDVLTGQLEQAEERFRALASEPGVETNSRVLNLWGITKLSLSDLESAEKQLRAAYGLITDSDDDYAEIANNFAWTLILLEHYDEALPILDSIIDPKKPDVTAMLNKAFILNESGKKAELSGLETELSRIAPLDRRVFSNLARAHLESK